MIFLIFAVIGLFGSLSLIFPNIPYNDPTIFFRKNRQRYLVFSNKFIGKFWLLVAGVSSILAIVQVLMNVNLNSKYVPWCYFAAFIIAFVILQVKWYRCRQKE